MSLLEICLFAILLIAPQAAAVANYSISLCNKTIDSANASGIYTYHVGYSTGITGNESIPDPSWAMTVNDHSNGPQTNLWYSTGGQNYSDDLALGYDVCAYYISQLPRNTVELGQNDPGDCSATLSDQCRTAILDRAAESAYKWVSYASPPPYSNLSAGVLPTICSYIIGDLGDNGFVYPKECSQEYGYISAPPNYDVMTTSIALTGYNDTGLDMNCPLQVGDKIYYNVWETLQTSPNTYDYATRNVFPILSVYMPVANIDRTWENNYAVSKLTCARAKQFSEGSRVSPALPSGTPYSYGQGLSKGAIAGVVVGVVVFVAILGGLVAYFFMRRRIRQSEQVKSPSKDKTLELDSGEVLELSPVDRKHEPDSKRDVVEMGEAQGKPAELGA